MWAKLDDAFPDHPKIDALGDLTPLAGWLFVCGLCYCGRYLTDGFIPAARVPKLGDFSAYGTTAAELAGVLVRVGLWEIVEGGFQVHDYDAYNPSREKVEADRASRQERGRKGADSRWHGGSDSSSQEAAIAARNDTSDAPVPVPSPSLDPSLTRPVHDKDKGLSLTDDSTPGDTLGYWLEKLGREPTKAESRSFRNLLNKYGEGTLDLAIGQAATQGESVANFALVTHICKEEAERQAEHAAVREKAEASLEAARGAS